MIGLLATNDTPATTPTTGTPLAAVSESYKGTKRSRSEVKADRAAYQAMLATPWVEGQVPAWLAAVQGHPGRAGVYKRVLAHTHHEAVRVHFRRLSASSVLSATDEGELREVAEGLEVPLEGDIKEVVTRAAISAGRLPTAPARNVICKPDEAVHYRVEAQLLDDVTTTTYKGGGSFASVGSGRSASAADRARNAEFHRRAFAPWIAASLSSRPSAFSTWKAPNRGHPDCKALSRGSRWRDAHGSRQWAPQGGSALDASSGTGNGAGFD